MQAKISADDVRRTHRAPDRPDWLPPIATATGVYFVEEFSGHFHRDDEHGLPRDVTGRYVGPVKIGWARNVHERLVTLQTGNPHWLYVRQVLLLPADYEHRLHRRFAANAMGGEWFDPSGGDMDHLVTAHTVEDSLAVKRWLDSEPPTTMAEYFAWRVAGWEAFR